MPVHGAELRYGQTINTQRSSGSRGQKKPNRENLENQTAGEPGDVVLGDPPSYCKMLRRRTGLSSQR